MQTFVSQIVSLRTTFVSIANCICAAHSKEKKIGERATNKMQGLQNQKKIKKGKKEKKKDKNIPGKKTKSHLGLNQKGSV